MQIDLVTIVFDDEVNLLYLQAHSISKYINGKHINKIHIIYNDSDFSIFEVFFYEKIYNQYGLLKDKIILHNYKNLIGVNSEINTWFGWRIQQLIKLTISDIVQTDHYLVLDSKNHFIRKFKLSLFFSKDKNILFVGNIGIMEKYFTNCMQYFGVEKQLALNLLSKESKTNIGNKLPITITPYLLKTDIVKKMINYLNIRENNFCTFFLNNVNITEFHMYSSFIIYSQMLNQFCISDRFDHIAIFNIYPQNETVFIDLVKKAINNDIVSFAIHRTRFKNLTTKQREILLELFNKFYDNEIVKYIENNIFTL